MFKNTSSCTVPLQAALFIFKRLTESPLFKWLLVFPSIKRLVIRVRPRLAHLVLATGDGAEVFSGQKFQLSTTFAQISVLKAAQGLNVVAIGPQVDVDQIGGVLFQGVNGGLPFLDGGPITKCHIALACFVGHQVDHLRRAIIWLQQHGFPAIPFWRKTQGGKKQQQQITPCMWWLQGLSMLGSKVAKWSMSKSRHS